MTKDAEATVPPSTGARPGFWTRRKRNGCFICLAIVIILVAILVPVLIKVVHPKIAQDSLNSAKLQFTSMNLTKLSNDAFTLNVALKVEDAGHTSATVSFEEPVTLSWVSPVDKQEKKLLEFNMNPFDTDSGNAFVNDTVDRVKVADIMSFGIFNKVLLGTEGFQWIIRAKASVKALGITSGGLTLEKTVDVKGMHGLPGITIKEFLITGPIINMTAVITNDSPIGIELIDIVFNITEPTSGFQLGTARSTSTQFLASGPSKLQLTAQLVPIGSIPAPLLEKLTPILGGIGAAPLVVTCTSIYEKAPVAWLSAALVGIPLPVSFGTGRAAPTTPTPAGGNSTAPAASASPSASPAAAA
ncbi:hypothetical protein HK104_001617 [Borealophlyctis nickersoniae]|nr:hypothetical protein HK104_001617 [Borealophlyctis nickersoniae]